MKFKLIICLFVLVSCSKSSNKKALEEELPTSNRKLANIKIFSANAEPISTITFEKSMMFGSTDSQFVTVGGPDNGLAVDNDGRVYIRDNELKTIHVYDKNGDYITRFGKKGRGPSEFQSMFTMREYQGNIFIRDAEQFKINVFDATDHFSLKKSITTNVSTKSLTEAGISDTHFVKEYYIVSDSTFLVALSPPPSRIEKENPEKSQIKYVLFNRKWEPISSQIFHQNKTKSLSRNFRGRAYYGMVFPFFRKGLFTFSNSSNRIYEAWSEDFLIKIFDKNGNYLRGFYYPVNKSSLDREEIIRKYDFGYDNVFLKTARTMTLPSTWPAINELLIDDEERLWVSRIVDNRQIYEWWVLKESGELIAKFGWPRENNIELIKNGYMYTQNRNVNSKGKVITRYKIQLTLR